MDGPETGETSRTPELDHCGTSHRRFGPAPPRAFLARQPIFHADRSVYAYELLYRDGLENAFHGPDGDHATNKLIADTFSLFGLDEIAGGKPVFINATRDFLLGEGPWFLPPARVVLEIVEDVEPDGEVLEACRRLRDAGYLLALDDFEPQHMDSPLVEVADIVKVETPAVSAPGRRRIIERFASRQVLLIAEKVEDEAAFLEWLDAGFSHFQGYFFARPVVLQRRSLTGVHAHALQILAEIGRRPLDFFRLEELVKHEPPIVLRLLRFLNSAFFATRQPVRSVRQAMVMLGEEELRRWLWVLLVADMGRDKPEELALLATVRARFCELLASATPPLAGRSENAFLTGLLSLAEAMLDCPLAEVLETLGVDPEIGAALRGEPGDLRSLHDAATGYERGHWAPMDAFAQAHGIEEWVVPALYMSAVSWAHAGLPSRRAAA